MDRRRRRRLRRIDTERKGDGERGHYWYGVGGGSRLTRQMAWQRDGGKVWVAGRRDGVGRREM